MYNRNSGLLVSLAFGSDKLIAFAVDIDDFNRRIVLQVLAQFGDVDIHRTGVKVIVVDPDGLESIVALEDFIDMGT